MANPPVASLTPSARHILETLAAKRPAFVAFAAARMAPADAEDVVQQAFRRAVEHVHSLREPRAAVAWFYQILRRSVADHHGAQARRPAAAVTLLAVEGATPPPTSLACACALTLLPTLKASQQQMLRRIDIDDEALPDVASSLGISRNNATVRLHRARRRLRQSVSAHCNRASATPCAPCHC